MHPVDPTTGLGLFAKRTLEAGDVFLSLPLSSLVSYDDAVHFISTHWSYRGEESRVKEIFVGDHESTLAALALYLLLQEDSAGSFYWKETTPNSGFLVPLEALTAVSRLRRNVHQLRQRCLNFYEALAIEASFEEWMRLISVVASRVHSVWMMLLINGRNETRLVKTLVPFADFINTGFQEEINSLCYTNQSTFRFECKATAR